VYILGMIFSLSFFLSLSLSLSFFLSLSLSLSFDVSQYKYIILGNFNKEEIVLFYEKCRSNYVSFLRLYFAADCVLEMREMVRCRRIVRIHKLASLSADDSIFWRSSRFSYFVCIGAMSDEKGANERWGEKKKEEKEAARFRIAIRMKSFNTSRQFFSRFFCF